MKWAGALLLVGLVTAVVTSVPAGAKKPIYRGVATNEWKGCGDLRALSRTSWYWNWTLKPNANVEHCGDLGRDVEFVPMVWGRAAAYSDIISQVHPPPTMGKNIIYVEY